MVAVKLIPHLLSWAAILLLLLRGFPGRRPTVAAANISGFALGAAATLLLFGSFPGEFTFGIIRGAVGGSFLLLWGASVAAIYRGALRESRSWWGSRFLNAPLAAAGGALAAGMIAGGICASRLSGADGNSVAFLLLALAGAALAGCALAADKWLPKSFTVSPAGLMSAVVALLLFSASYMIRLDIFAPLTMKVMKFTHDFVHQFFESMLIPDHLFILPYLWDYIGLLFGKEVGFWGGLVIWFTPALLVILAIRFERLPSVAHIRQGAERRKLLAAAIRARRFLLLVPLIALVIFAVAVYRSRFPSVEYWDPKPVPVTASAAGEIFIPKSGEIDIEDGKLHKYLYKQGGKEARFFVLMTPEGELTVDLDACAICKPDGYGQAEGTVLCYYCNTLIPLETVGKPGGCNPVPIPFEAKEDGVHVDALTLINTWSSTIQSTSRVKEEGK
ncbi:MAG: hypothetical protein A2075_06070 [Geobacteraceae bacterium GWC2_58_44]|nr:MAG: hypothetical protein A2075_06070 [Geobacteraceae bacterium GWC2_58_44]HBG05729.1 DUF2318 domain-containing protein [Geobacter sp.]